MYSDRNEEKILFNSNAFWEGMNLFTLLSAIGK